MTPGQTRLAGARALDLAGLAAAVVLAVVVNVLCCATFSSAGTGRRPGAGRSVPQQRRRWARSSSRLSSGRSWGEAIRSRSA